MRRRALLAAVGMSVSSSGCLTTHTGDKNVQLQYLEITHGGDKAETYHLILRTADEIDYWTSIDVESESITTVCDDGWSDEVSSFELLVRLDEQSEWKSWEVPTGDVCPGIFYTDSDGLGFYEGSCSETCPNPSGSNSKPTQNASNSSSE